MNITENMTKLMDQLQVYDFGFSRIPEAPEGLPNAISIVVPLSDSIIDEIQDTPTHTYFHHYRTVNAYIDRILLEIGMFLQRNGYKYIPIAASQTINTGDGRDHMARFSHKKAAVLAGLGTIGKSTLFLHRKLGPRVRLGTLFTDCPLTCSMTQFGTKVQSNCGHCSLCTDACPAKAITGEEWHEGTERSELFDARACNDYMRKHFMKIGRGAVCGICMKVCKSREVSDH